MYVAIYDIDGDPAVLVPAYDRMIAQFPADTLVLHLCVARPGGLSVIDGCPSREDFEAFRDSPEFAGALAAAGLPTPRCTPLGELHHAIGTAVPA